MWLQVHLTFPMIKQGQADEELPLQPLCACRGCLRSVRSCKGGLKADQELLCGTRMGKQSLVQRVPSWSPAQGRAVIAALVKEIYNPFHQLWCCGIACMAPSSFSVRIITMLAGSALVHITYSRRIQTSSARQ